MKVEIGGVSYIPETDVQVPSFGVAITTRNRPEQLERTLEEWKKYTPDNIPIIVIDDASNKPNPHATFTFADNVGVAAVKNKSIELLQQLGVQHMFLSDDDFYPTQTGWWIDYINHTEPHLMYLFYDFSKAPLMNTNSVIYKDNNIVAYGDSRGCMLYLDAHKVLPEVGGMDEVYGRWGYEHSDWSERIWRAGLTSFPYQDHPTSSDFFKSLDEDHEIERSVPLAERKAHIAVNEQIWKDRWTSDYEGFAEYKEQKHEVIGVLFNTIRDDQRQQQTHKVSDTLDWSNSVNKHYPNAHITLLTDHPVKDKSKTVKYIEDCELHWSVYYERVNQISKYLNEACEADVVWCTDTTDVQMHNKPTIEPGKLYVGYETSTTLNDWLKNSTGESAQVTGHLFTQAKTLLNCGVIGGDKETVTEFFKDWKRYYVRYLMNVHQGNAQKGEVLDMVGFNVTAHSDKWKDRVVFGPHVTTVFKKNEAKSNAWWRHK